ncbi:Allantoinase [Microbacterium laevaniformans]|uniref:Allantoinase n=1 Tax=Microbacterium laevaniformans TaxID=36807 RepID=A0A150HEG6_9MICO|nr:hypothetical protein [Microbacterium laevaniformans]KXZ60523.1 Allantoinase [Microbacterium laevaniformans]
MSSTPAAIDLVRNVRLWSHPADPVDVHIVEGTITAITPAATQLAPNVVNGRGLLALPGLVNAHAHIDKS